MKEGKLYEVFIRNNSVSKTGGTVASLWVKDVKIDSGTLIFEGIKVVNGGPGVKADSVTYTKVDKAIEGLEIPISTYGAFRAALPKIGPQTQLKGSFTVYQKEGEGKSWDFKFPWDPNPEKTTGPWSGEYSVYEEGTTNVSIAKNIYKAVYPEVLIVGSGPLGATYARKIVEAEHEVLMVEMGAQETKTLGGHKKNAIAFQKDIDSFVNVIKGDLSTLSVPVRDRYTANLNPISWNSSKSFTRNGQNPEQKEFDNLGGAATTRCVGGMFSHWTCSTPEQHETLERSKIFTNDEWKDLYQQARGILGTSRDEFLKYSIRDQLVKKKLEDVFPKLFPGKAREVKSLPLACKRNVENPDFVTWTGADTVLGQLAHLEAEEGDTESDKKRKEELKKKFQLLSQHQCTKVLYQEGTGSVNGKPVLAIVKKLASKERIHVFAEKYVICGGSVLTPQILFNSGFRPTDESLPALGHYMTEQTMSFCQIILKEEFVKEVENTTNPEWRKKIDRHKKKHPEDPLPFPYNDPDPQLTTPVSTDFPWHTQIHRDAFSYGDVAQNLDSRLVVDFRFFGMVEVEKSNCVTFSSIIRDNFHMPQPTFHFIPCEEARKRSHRMMQDMCTIASEIGGYLPGSEPQFMEPGLALHICGTTRAGTDKKDSVVNRDSKVHGIDNLWLGGNNVIPTMNASNPTITSMCFALMGAKKLIEELKAGI